MIETGWNCGVDQNGTCTEICGDGQVVGDEPCETVKKYDLKLVPVTDADKAIIENAVNEISFPAWAEVCDKQNATCSEDWKAAIGAVMSQ